MLFKILSTMLRDCIAVLISVVWMVSLTVLVGCGAVWALQKLGGM